MTVWKKSQKTPQSRHFAFTPFKISKYWCRSKIIWPLGASSRRGRRASAERASQLVTVAEKGPATRMRWLGASEWIAWMAFLQVSAQRTALRPQAVFDGS